MTTDLLVMQLKFQNRQYQRPVLEVIRSRFHPPPTATVHFVTILPCHLLLGLQTLENKFYRR
jgi:hypothetical protein